MLQKHLPQLPGDSRGPPRLHTLPHPCPSALRGLGTQLHHRVATPQRAASLWAPERWLRTQGTESDKAEWQQDGWGQGWGGQLGACWERARGVE